MAKKKQDEKDQNISDMTKESQWWVREVKSWLSRVPCASLIAFCMCAGGIILFSGCLYEALKFLVQQFDLDIISKIVWLIMILHLVMGAFFLLVAALSTGGTRKEVCTKCVAFNVAGRCIQCVNIGVAYLFHFIWLILPAVLLLPVALVAGFAILCTILPDCITLSDYGVPPELVDQVNPDDIIDKIRSINSSDLEVYIDQAETVIQGAIENAEDSPLLEDLLTKIENNIPSEEEIEKIVNMVVDNIDTEKVIGVIDQIQDGVDRGAEKIQDAIDKVADKIDNSTFGETLVDHLDNMDDSLEGLTNRSSEMLDTGLDDVTTELDENVNKTMNSLPNPGGATSNTTASTARSLRKRQIEEDKEKVEREIQSMQDKAKEDLDNIKEGVSNFTRDANQRAQDELAALKNETEKQVTGIKDAANDMMKNATEALEDTKDEVLKQAETLKETAKETADAIRSQAETTATELKEEAEKTAEEIKKQAVDVAKELEEKGKQVAEDVKKVIEEEQERIRQGLADAKEYGNKTLHDLKDKATEIGKDAKKMGEEAMQDLIKNAKIIADEAKIVAEVAQREAEKALAKAMEAAKNVAMKVDKKAKALARETEKNAKAAAEAAKSAATSALQKAKQAMENADELADAVSKGAADLIRKAAKNVRSYAKEAIRIAKLAAREAAKGARQAAKMYDKVKDEVLKGYEMLMVVSDQLGIERKNGTDTFCSEAKVFYCKEITKSSICLVFVFLASIILNLSMVHFLMAMAANYVHITREMKLARLEAELQEANEAEEFYSFDDSPEPIALPAVGDPLLDGKKDTELYLNDTGPYTTQI